MASIACVLRRASAKATKTGHDKKYLLSARVCRAARSFSSSSEIGSNSWVIAAIRSSTIFTPILLMYASDRDVTWLADVLRQALSINSSRHSALACVPHVEHRNLADIVDVG